MPSCTTISAAGINRSGCFTQKLPQPWRIPRLAIHNITEMRAGGVAWLQAVPVSCSPNQSREPRWAHDRTADTWTRETDENRPECQFQKANRNRQSRERWQLPSNRNRQPDSRWCPHRLVWWSRCQQCASQRRSRRCWSRMAEARPVQAYHLPRLSSRQRLTCQTQIAR